MPPPKALMPASARNPSIILPTKNPIASHSPVRGVGLFMEVLIVPERKNVLPRVSLLTESLLKNLVSGAISSVQHKHGMTDKELAEALFCDPGTIANARNRDNKLQAQTLFNLITVDVTAIEPLLHHYGRRSVPIEARCNTDELVSTSAAVASIALVKSPDSHGGVNVTDVECLEIEHSVDAALEALSALKQRAVQIRAARAA